MRSYLDFAATAPLRPEAREAAASLASLPGSAVVGNPTGSHWAARRAKSALEEARECFAGLFAVKASEIVFTSGGTESDNLAIEGTLARRGGVPLCSSVEHHAVLEACRRRGGRIVAVDGSGRVDLNELESLLGPEVSLVSVMAVNNETGVLNDLDSVAAVIARVAPHALLHSDAVQALNWADLAETTRCAALVSLSAHKFGGPPGVGVLVAREGREPAPLAVGGGQENGLRSGTPPVAAIAGAAAAARAAAASRSGEIARVAALRKRLVAGLTHELPLARPVVEADDSVPGIVDMVFPGVENEELLVLLDSAGVAASGGSSCSSGALEPSHVLIAMGLDPVEARSAVRFSMGWSTTEGEIDHAVEATTAAVRRLSARVP